MVKKALGKGLSAILPESRANADGQGLYQLPVARILPNRSQPRKMFGEHDLLELKESIAQHGILQPILVRRKGDGFYELIAGERRFRAAQQAKLQTVPAIVRQSKDDESTLFALIENIQRVDLTPVEEAKAYRHLMDESGLTQEAVAGHVGRDRASVANLCRVLSLPHDVQNMLESGQLTLGHAKAMLGIKGARDQSALAARIIQGRLSVRQAEQLVKKWPSGRRPVQKTRQAASGAGPLDAGAEDRLRKHLGTKVAVRAKQRGGELIVSYYSREDLTRIVDVILSSRPARA